MKVQSESTKLRESNGGLDTDLILPSFSSKEEYTAYLQKAGSLPDGFALGTAKGTFVSVEAPAMGPLPIKATVIHLTEGPTDSWAVKRTVWLDRINPNYIKSIKSNTLYLTFLVVSM